MSRSMLVSASGLAAALAVMAACGGTSTPAPTPVPTPGATASPAAVAPPTATPSSAPAAMTLTVENDTCTYDGPTTIPYGTYEVTFDVRDLTYPTNGWFVFVLDAGRTVEEARALFGSTDDTTGPPPAWLTMLTVHAFGGAPGTVETRQENLRQMGAYKDGPIYILCARPDHVYDIFGPIEVTQ